MRERFIISFKKNLLIIVAFAVAFVLIRFYGWWAIADRIGNETSGVATLQFRGMLEDIGASIYISIVVLVISQLVALFSEQVAQVISIVLFSFVLLLSFAINQYFVVTLIPLSSDLLGYSAPDISTTVGSSGSTLNSSLLVCLFILIVFWLGIFLFSKRNLSEKITTRAALISFASMLVFLILPWRIQAEDYENDMKYFVAANKVRFLNNRIAEVIMDSSEKRTFAKDVYPMLHKMEYTDSLGSYFNTAEGSYPNLVFVIVEGLGRDFCGANAPYGGFTPFVDSLSKKSLYWENALSNAGRTFGAPPSILGSLPYARLGMMGYGNNMPDHQTLISLLKPMGYRSNFFYGGNPNFDNLDLFLERQGVDFFMNESSFPSGTKKEFWGVSDSILFSAALKKIENESSQRIDVFLTLSTHEPFICPDSSFMLTADKRINELPDSKKKEIMRGNKSVFECLLYTDNALRNLITGYSKRPDFKNTIFVITGDHRLIPVPQDNKIKRYHVPILIYSPLLKENKTFFSMVTHSDILPSVLGLLKDKYAMNFPAELPLISKGLSTNEKFSSDLDIALIRNKNEVKDFVSGSYFLSEDRLYSILPDMKLEIVHEDSKKKELKDKMKAFQDASVFAFENNRLDKVANTRTSLFSFTSTEEDFIKNENIAKLSPDDIFLKAKELAFAKQYVKSRCLTKFILNKSPNYHDARILMSRTYAWSGKYDSATLYLKQTLQRAPNYADAYAALSDVEYWQDQTKTSLNTIETGLKANATDAELLARKARVLAALNRKQEAKRILNDLVKRGVENEITSQLKRNLK